MRRVKISIVIIFILFFTLNTNVFAATYWNSIENSSLRVVLEGGDTPLSFLFTVHYYEEWESSNTIYGDFRVLEKVSVRGINSSTIGIFNWNSYTKLYEPYFGEKADTGSFNQSPSPGIWPTFEQTTISANHSAWWVNTDDYTRNTSGVHLTSNYTPQIHTLTQ